MTQMTDPHDGLMELQKAIDARIVQMTPCDLHPDICVLFDTPNGEHRFSYALIEAGEIKSFAVYVMADPLNGLPCFSVGYAVPEKYRKQGLATDILVKSSDELRHGFGRNGIKEFYLEAVVGTDNLGSNRLASTFFDTDGKQCTDSYSGKSALAYTKLISA
ncbi:hypothetical protein [Rheinheimera sp. MM224]|uniref:hypothetical protein n=1 Tax=Rheinheimera sp. MM224 TaxID=3019969 RepID=UPI0021F90EAF|nr:hypothetical protein [Rheinheimera sp. MM224]CAI3798501.1 hypothetical protein JAMGFMIE_02086 [Rheinheimera sp. MM224]